MNALIAKIVAALVSAFAAATYRHFGIVAAWILILAGLIFGSMASLILGLGVLVYFLWITKRDQNADP